MVGSLSTGVNKPVNGVIDYSAEKAAVDLWTRAIERLKARLSRHTFQTYFEPIKPVSLDANELTLAHSSKFMIDWVRDNPGRRAIEIAHGVFGPNAIQPDVYGYLLRLEQRGRVIRDNGRPFRWYVAPG